MFPNCIDCFGRQETETKQQQTNKEKSWKKKTIKNGNKSIYHEQLSKK